MVHRSLPRCGTAGTLCGGPNAGTIGVVKVTDTLELLLGTWAVERVVYDRRNRAAGILEGTLKVIVQDGTWPASLPRAMRRARYEETGRFRFRGHDGPAARTLLCLGRNDGTVLLQFVDGRPFVECDLRAGKWLAYHPCGEDSYEVAFSALSHDLLRERWRVTGPSKDYEAWTTLRRLGTSCVSPRAGDRHGRRSAAP